MAWKIERAELKLPRGYPSSSVASFLAQLDELTERLTEDVRNLDVGALEWQPAPGMNTIGMLLAHIAIVEVFWTQVGPLGLSTFESESVLGIGIDDDGMPMPAGGAPPAGLAGKSIATFNDLLARARAYSRRAIAVLADGDLDRVISRTRRDGSVHETDMRWILYHMVEHFAGHYGQINVLQHLHRETRVPGPPTTR
jgi:uncharacterized damage-inducible protein DinB